MISGRKNTDFQSAMNYLYSNFKGIQENDTASDQDIDRLIGKIDELAEEFERVLNKVSLTERSDIGEEVKKK